MKLIRTLLSALAIVFFCSGVSHAQTQRLMLPRGSFKIPAAGSSIRPSICLDYHRAPPAPGSSLNKLLISSHSKVIEIGNQKYSLHEAIQKKLLEIRATQDFLEVEFKNLSKQEIKINFGDETVIAEKFERVRDLPNLEVFGKSKGIENIEEREKYQKDFWKTLEAGRSERASQVDKVIDEIIASKKSPRDFLRENPRSEIIAFARSPKNENQYDFLVDRGNRIDVVSANGELRANTLHQFARNESGRMDVPSRLWSERVDALARDEVAGHRSTSTRFVHFGAVRGGTTIIQVGDRSLRITREDLNALLAGNEISRDLQALFEADVNYIFYRDQFARLPEAERAHLTLTATDPSNFEGYVDSAELVVRLQQQRPTR